MSEDVAPSRWLIATAAGVLALVTGIVVWLLPSGASTAARPAAASTPHMEPPATVAPIGLEDSIRPARPDGFVAFVDSGSDPAFDLPGTATTTGTRWFTVGYLTAGADGCTPLWGGSVDPGRNPVANRVGELRALGGDVRLAFGGPNGREPSRTCSDLARLTAAYRRIIGAFDARHIDFEVTDAIDVPTTVRRAYAIAALQREAAVAGRRLDATFTVPATRRGLSGPDVVMLRTMRSRGATVSAVNLLAPGASVAPLLRAVGGAQKQIATSLGISAAEAWRTIGLTPVLADSDDLSRAEATALVRFATTHGLAWLSVRGASPTQAVSEILAGNPLQ